MKQKDSVAGEVIKVLKARNFPQGLELQDALHQLYLIIDALNGALLKEDEVRQHGGGPGPHYPVYLLLQFEMESRASEAEFNRAAVGRENAG